MGIIHKFNFQEGKGLESYEKNKNYMYHGTKYTK